MSPITDGSGGIPQLDELLGLIRATSPELRTAAPVIEASAISGWQRGRRPVRALVEAGLDIVVLESIVWASRGFAYVTELPDVVSTDLIDAVPPHDCLDLGVFPVVLRKDRVVVALLDPFDRSVVEEIRNRFPTYEIELVVTNRAAIEKAVEGMEVLAGGADLVDESALTRAAWLRSMEAEAVASGRIADLADLLIERAYLTGASDLHIEPDGDHCDIRFRLDGVLTQVSRYPGAFAQTLVNRVKILSLLDVGDRRTPQDGRATALYGGRSVDLRVVTIPTAWGSESCVIRLLRQSRVQPELSSLGFSRPTRTALERLLALQGGVILATGPTGSGKTTTLYSALQMVTTTQVKTITVEDPVEYRMAGMQQVQVDRSVDFDFPAALRSILRADPDVILIGEIRDAETARTAVAAALTGQLVMASLHAATAASAPLRLMDLGVEGFMVAGSLRGVVNQRLIRRLCRRCRSPYVPRQAQLDDSGWPFSRPARLWAARPGGCDSCFGTGYQGRSVIAEVLTVDDALRMAIADRAAPVEIERLAVVAGMIPIRHDALRAARLGATSLEEISRVLGER